MTEPDIYQGMSLTVLAKMLAMAQAYDPKFSFDDADILRAYQRVAQDYRWTAHEVAAAIHKWGATEAADGFMSPAKLNDLIRVARNDALMRKPVATAFGPKVAEETVRQRVMAVWAQESRLSKGRSKARKAMIAKHSDLVEQFNEIGFMRFEAWNGWVAPATVPASGEGANGPTTDVGHGYRSNTSPTRAAVVAIVEEAQRREAS